MYYYQDGKEKRQIFKAEPFEWCEFMEGAKVNPMAKRILNTFAKSLKPIFKKCPLSGRFVINLKFDSAKNFIAMLPKGNYEMGEKLYTDDDPDLLAISLIIKIY